MRISCIILAIFFSASVMAHPAVSRTSVWSRGTDMESNNTFFSIQKCTDGIHFTDIVIIPSQAKNENTSVPLTYSFRIFNEGIQAGMEGILLFTVILGGIQLISKLNKSHRSL